MSTTVTVTRMQHVRMTRLHSPWSALVRQDTRTSARMARLSAKVCFDQTIVLAIKFVRSVDSCKVNNGGCDKHADCTHDSKTFAVVCTCKTGYTNVGTGGVVKCEGTLTCWKLYFSHQVSIVDSCNVNNGGCDKNAACSHDKDTFAVVCTCKTGYTNVGSGSTVKCEGMF